MRTTRSPTRPRAGEQTRAGVACPVSLARLAEVGHRPARFTEEVATRMPTPEEARFLRLTDPEPIFNLFRTAFDEAGTPVEVCEHVRAGDRWLLTYEWAAD